MFRFLMPKESLDEREVEGGLRSLVYDAMFAQANMVLTTGAFLIGFALAMGASKSVIGILAGLGPLALVVQVPAVYLVQKVRRRKLILVLSTTVSRLMWFVIPAIPFLLAPHLRLPVFLGALFVHYSLGNVGGCAFNAWIRDLIPEHRLSAFFARRMALATATGAGLSLLAGFGVDYWKLNLSNLPGGILGGYGAVFILAACCGMLSVYYLIRTPEPVMPPGEDEGFFHAIRQPLRDRNFRKLLAFLGSWNFALNFATPFFAVYLLERLDLSMSWVIGLGVFSQLVNVAFFRFWGGMADRFSNRAVLMVTVPLFVFSFLLWPFTTMPEVYVLTIPLLVGIHVLSGIATAGVNLCAGNLALKLAPYGKGGAYLAVNALVSGLAATVSPVMAGFSADWFETKQMTLTLRLASTAAEGGAFEMPAMDIRGLDFLFLIAFALGLYCMHRLTSVRERGEVEEAEMRRALIDEMGRAVRQVSTVAGVRQIFMAPFSLFRGKAKTNRIQPPEPEGSAETS